MGAGTTEVRDSTTDVLLEAAVWDPAAVSRTLRRLHLPSEAGRRYERSVDPAVSVAALDRCAALLAEIAGGTVEPKLTDWRGDPPRDDWSPAAVSMPTDLPDRTAGVDYPEGTTQRRLTQIGAEVTVDGDRVTATPPSWRPDLLQPADLVEEVLRLEGLGDHPVGAAAGAGRARPDPGAEAPSRDRKVVGAQRLCRDTADSVPARRSVRPVGLGRPTTRAAPPPHVLNPLESDRPELATTLLPGAPGSTGPQRIPRGGRRRPVRDRAGRASRRRRRVPSN